METKNAIIKSAKIYTSNSTDLFASSPIQKHTALIPADWSPEAVKSFLDHPDADANSVRHAFLDLVNRHQTLCMMAEGMAAGWEAEDDDVPTLMDGAVSCYRDWYPLSNAASEPQGEIEQ